MSANYYRLYVYLLRWVRWFYALSGSFAWLFHYRTMRCSSHHALTLALAQGGLLPAAEDSLERLTHVLLASMKTSVLQRTVMSELWYTLSRISWVLCFQKDCLILLTICWVLFLWLEHGLLLLPGIHFPGSSAHSYLEFKRILTRKHEVSFKIGTSLVAFPFYSISSCYKSDITASQLPHDMCQ